MSELKIGALAREITDKLTPIYGQGEAKAMTRLIFQTLKGWNQTQLIINSDQPASEYIVRKTSDILVRLLTNEPIQYILGEAYFYGMVLKVDKSTLIPRPETEQLVDLIYDRYKEQSDLSILDIGTGSGAIALALARHLPYAKISAIDISAEAIKVAKANADSLSLKVDFRICDVFSFDPTPDSFDIIVSNPPYVDESEKSEMQPNVLNYEPHTALFVPDSNPLLFYRKISEIGLKALKPGGSLFFEINPRHSQEMKQMLATLGYTDIDIIKDIHQRNRFVIATKQ